MYGVHYQQAPRQICDGHTCLQTGAQSAIDKIVTTGFRAIQLIYFFTAGADEVKCWQIRKHSKAPQVLFLAFAHLHVRRASQLLLA